MLRELGTLQPLTYKHFILDRTATPKQCLDLRNADGEPFYYKRYRNTFQRLTDVLKYNFTRKGHGPQTPVKWILIQVAPTTAVNVLQFDFDMHPGDDPEKFKADKKRLQSAAKKLGGDVIFTTSPGDIYDGQHIQGAYGFVKLDRPMTMGGIIENKRSILDLFGVDVEFSGSSEYRNLRVPGIQYVELVDPDTGELIDPVAKTEPAIKALEVFAKAWHDLKPVHLPDFSSHIDLDYPEETTPVKIQTPNLGPTSLRRYDDALKRMNVVASKNIRAVNGVYSDELVASTIAEFVANSTPYGFADHVDNAPRMNALALDCLKFCLDSYKPVLCGKKPDNWNRTRTFLRKRSNRSKLILRVPHRLRLKTLDLIELFRKYDGWVYHELIYGKTGVFTSSRDWALVRHLFPVQTAYVKPIDKWVETDGILIQERVRGKCSQYAIGKDLTSPPPTKCKRVAGFQVGDGRFLGLEDAFKSLISGLDNHFAENSVTDGEPSLN